MEVVGQCPDEHRDPDLVGPARGGGIRDVSLPIAPELPALLRVDGAGLAFEVAESLSFGSIGRRTGKG